MTEQQTNNVAKIHAVKMAICFFLTAVTGLSPLAKDIKEVLQVTDSTYAVDFLCRWIASWELNGRRTSNGESIVNVELISNIQEQLQIGERQHGIVFKFWLVAKELNAETHRLAHVAFSSYLHGDFEHTVCLPSQSWNSGTTQETTRRAQIGDYATQT
jgi:ribonuclease HI